MRQQPDLIYTYTRQEAIEDGVLVDVSETAKEAGFKYPVAVTRSIWNEIIEPDAIAQTHGEDAPGRLWDVLWMLKCASRNSSGDTLIYSLLATKDGRKHIRKLKAVCSPGDMPEPVITIMLPEED
jgi:hypothetical protein